MNNYKILTTIIIAVCFLTGCGGNETVESDSTEQLLTEAVETADDSSLFGPELTSLSPGRNEIELEYDGLSRRLLITTPKTYDDQKKYSILFCFHGAGGKVMGQGKKWILQLIDRAIMVCIGEA